MLSKEELIKQAKLELLRELTKNRMAPDGDYLKISMTKLYQIKERIENA